MQDREISLKKRECECIENEIRLSQLTRSDFKHKYDKLKEDYESEILALKNEIKEKTKENRRLQDSFKIIKQANDSLKSQVAYFILFFKAG